MPGNVDWLPALIKLSDHGGDSNKFLDAVYEAFCADFVHSKPLYAGKRFGLKRYPLSQGREATFWHVASEGTVESQRTISIPRCERIRWPRPIIEAIETDRVRVWKNSRGSDDRIVLAIDDFSYVVVLDERDTFVMLWTAYVVEHEHRRRKLQKEFEAWNSQAKKS